MKSTGYLWFYKFEIYRHYFVIFFNRSIKFDNLYFRANQTNERRNFVNFNTEATFLLARFGGLGFYVGILFVQRSRFFFPLLIRRCLPNLRIFLRRRNWFEFIVEFIMYAWTSK